VKSWFEKRWIESMIGRAWRSSAYEPPASCNTAPGTESEPMHYPAHRDLIMSRCLRVQECMTAHRRLLGLGSGAVSLWAVADFVAAAAACRRPMWWRRFGYERHGPVPKNDMYSCDGSYPGPSSRAQLCDLLPHVSVWEFHLIFLYRIPSVIMHGLGSVW